DVTALPLDLVVGVDAGGGVDVLDLQTALASPLTTAYGRTAGGLCGFGHDTSPFRARQSPMPDVPGWVTRHLDHIPSSCARRGTVPARHIPRLADPRGITPAARRGRHAVA